MFRLRNLTVCETKSLLKYVSGRSVSMTPQLLTLIQIGDPMPKGILYEDYPGKIIKMPDFVLKKKIVLFAVPGAFTPGCSKTHLPGYLNIAEDLKNEGVDEIICLSVNDAYVMGAWSNKHRTRGKIRMLADPTGNFILALGLGMQNAALGGYRAKRFSMIITDNKLKALYVEPDGTGLSCSLASALNYKKYIKSDGVDLY